MKSPYETALAFIERSISVIPVAYRAKTPALAEWSPYRHRLPTAGELRRWFPGRLHNLGVLAGWNDLAILDFDNFTEYGKWLVWMQRRGRASALFVETAYQVRTNRGVHVYFRLPGGRSLKIRDEAGQGIIDVQAAGRYVLGPGSTHPAGAIYTPLRREMLFPLVRSLSDVLPESLLSQTGPAPSPAPLRQLPGALHARCRIEDFFPGRKASSRVGRFCLAACPFHDDKHPSFWIDTQRQVGNCFACAFPRPLGVVDLVSRLYGLSKAESIRYLAAGPR